MQPTAAIIIPDGFEEIEALTVLDILRRGGVEVTLVGYKSITCKGAHDLIVQTDDMLGNISSQTFECVVLPGGPGCYSMRMDKALQTFVQKHFQTSKLVCAICAAPLVLYGMGVSGKLIPFLKGFYHHDYDPLEFLEQIINEPGQQGNVSQTRTSLDTSPRPTFNFESLIPAEQNEFLELQYLITRSKASPEEIRRFCQLEQRGIFPGMDPNFDHLIPNPQFNFDALSFLEQQDLIELESQNFSELSPAEIQKFRELERKGTQGPNLFH